MSPQAPRTGMKVGSGARLFHCDGSAPFVLTMLVMLAIPWYWPDLPREARKKLGVGPGARLLVLVKDDRIVFMRMCCFCTI